MYGKVCSSVAMLVVAAIWAGVVNGAESFDPPRFVSPDGRRAVRLSLMRFDSKADWPGLDRTLIEAARKAGPSLQIEFSMRSGANEVLIRPFTSRPAGGERAHYRVLWDARGTRFIVLSDAPPEPADGSRAQLPTWATGETVVFFHDRESETSSTTARYRPEQWTASTMQGPNKGSRLPMLVVTFAMLSKFERVGKTGEMQWLNMKPPRAERIENFTIHPNTQTLRKDDPRPLFAMPRTLLNAPSPDGEFQARVMGGRPPAVDNPMVVLAEGDAFRDQLWVLLYSFRAGAPKSAGGSEPTQRFVWSNDSRYVLLLTRESGRRGLARIASGEELYLLFDTERWEGVIAPELNAIEGLGFAL